MEKFKLFLWVFFMATLLIACEKKYETANLVTLHKLYSIFKNGEIDEYTLNKKAYFVAGENVYNAAAFAYDNNGIQVGTCNYAWNSVDPICKQFKDCEVIYRCENHITGLPPVDKYHLSN